MRHLFMALVMFGLSSSAFAGVGPLDDKSFCRTLVSGGVFGQPAGQFNHCLDFKDGFVTDNSNAFFGNPPDPKAEYVVNGLTVTFGSDEYTLSADGKTLTTVRGSAIAGTEFDLK